MLTRPMPFDLTVLRKVRWFSSSMYTFRGARLYRGTTAPESDSMSWIPSTPFFIWLHKSLTSVPRGWSHEFHQRVNVLSCIASCS